MPSPNDYRKLLGKKTLGQARKDMADALMDYTWDGDIQSRVIYLFDYWHDYNKTILDDIPIDEDNMIPIDAKFVMYSSQTFDKDQVTFHLQFRPGQKCNVDYYDEFFQRPYDSTFPIGLYCAIPDEQGIFNRWLVVDKANYNVTQFPTFEILRCDKVFEWIFDEKKFRCPGVLRSQNSYNSGIWSDLIYTFPEDQYKFCLPINRDTENIYQNQRIIIDNRVFSEPRTWQISKINRVAPNGIVRLTIAQDRFDPNRDYIEHLDPKDDKSPIIGQWAGYYDEPNTPEEPEDTDLAYGEIKYSGKPELKISGRYKKLSVEFEDGVFRSGTWNCYYEKDDDKTYVFDKIEFFTTPDLKANEIKARLTIDPEVDEDWEDYLKRTLTIKYITTDGIKISLKMNIVYAE